MRVVAFLNQEVWIASCVISVYFVINLRLSMYVYSRRNEWYDERWLGKPLKCIFSLLFQN